ncbi:unnamed protein product [Rotaria socialis]|uniref:DNA/RNA-binding protein Kin17 WH-like domain-containing protein n=1 Tax=Rotaria socialis TaxID=392032 RepID=A0A821GEJ0_9BILA|nr:unnamed protein product [Rotaria socialis]
MGKARGFLTPKAISNRIKSKGLQKLQWYCQAYQKQCRNENGFKCHILSESHRRQILLAGENLGKYIADYSCKFHSELFSTLSRSLGRKHILANTVYCEYIKDRHHIHMTATRCLALTGYNIPIEVQNRYHAIIKMIDTNDKIRIDQVHIETVIPAIGKKKISCYWSTS